MKILPLILFLFAAVAAFAQEKVVSDPPELMARREEYLRALQRAASPVMTNYLRSLQPLKAQFSREGRIDAALAVDNEIKKITQDLQVATNAASSSVGASMQLTIVSATYGEPAKKRVTDITKHLRKVHESGQASVKLNTQDGAEGTDPAPYAAKQTTIVYTINGQKREKTFPEGHQLNFKDDLR